MIKAEEPAGTAEVDVAQAAGRLAEDGRAGEGERPGRRGRGMAAFGCRRDRPHWLQHQRVRSDERVRADVQRLGPEIVHLGAKVGGHHADLRPAEPGDLRNSTSFSIRRAWTPST